MPPQQAPVQPPYGQQQGYAQPQGYARQQSFPQQQAGYDRAPQQQGYGQQTSNVVPFPGMQRAADGSVYAHVEYIVLLRSRNECKDVIAYIKTNASVFLNMEFIASDSERQRCVDMLSGAAYTLGCALNKISPRGIYLISSPSVRVVLDPAMRSSHPRRRRKAMPASTMRVTATATAAISRQPSRSPSSLWQAFRPVRPPRAFRRRVPNECPPASAA